MERGYILDIGINNVLKMVGKGKAANFSDIKVTILNFKVSAERKLLKKNLKNLLACCTHCTPPVDSKPAYRYGVFTHLLARRKKPKYLRLRAHCCAPVCDS